MKKVLFFAVTNNPNIDEKIKSNYEYPNFFYSVFLNTLRHMDGYSVSDFKRHE